MNFAVLKMYAEDNRDSRGWGRYQKFLQAIISSIENLFKKNIWSIWSIWYHKDAISHIKMYWNDTVLQIAGGIKMMNFIPLTFNVVKQNAITLLLKITTYNNMTILSSWFWPQATDSGNF